MQPFGCTMGDENQDQAIDVEGRHHLQDAICKSSVQTSGHTAISNALMSAYLYIWRWHSMCSLPAPAMQKE